MKEGPKQIEMDQIRAEQDSLKALRNLRKSERRALKDFSKFIERLDDVNKHFKDYKQAVFDSSRNYIQMLNQGTEIIDNQFLNLTKEHLKRLDLTITAQQDISNTLKELERAYSEYLNNLEKLESSWEQLVKAGNDWMDYANDYAKERGEYMASSKLERLEKGISKSKDKLKKAYVQKSRTHQMVSTAYDHLNQSLQKLKGAIKNIRW